MRILIASHRFWPSVGGVESVGRMLAGEFSEQGHQVRVVTNTPSSAEGETLYKVLRRPSPWALLSSVHWCDVYLHNNISLRAAWPLLCISRPWAVTHHTWIRRTHGRIAWQDRLKLAVARQATSIAISSAVAENLPCPAQIIPDPYDDSVFQLQPDAVRRKDLVFMGRLVSDKGVDLALQALANLRSEGLTPFLTIVGEGPERANLEQFCRDHGLCGQVRFVGVKTGGALATVLNEHRIMVVPSRGQEPFGIGALEGIACGCVVVGAAGGGLKEAMGPCGLTFPNGDVGALSQSIRQLLQNPAMMAACREPTREHLHQHRLVTVARAYVRILEVIEFRIPHERDLARQLRQ